MKNVVEGLKVAGQRSLCLLCFFVAITGCKEKAVQQESASEPAYSKQYRENSAIVVVSLSETNLPTSGKIQLTLDIHAPKHKAVSISGIDEAFDPFTVAETYAEPVQALPGGKQLHRKVWTLYPGLPGEFSIQPLDITVGATTLKTEPVKTVITTRLPADTENLQIRDIAKPVDLLPEEKKRNQRGLILAIAVGITALIMVGIKWICRPKTIPTRSPEETVSRTLDHLPELELQRIQVLTDALLLYLEQRLNVPTTGKTLEEIFPKLPRELLLGRREPLQQMLITSEQARFSHKVPFGFASEMQEYVRSFVEKMKEELCD